MTTRESERDQAYSVFPMCPLKVVNKNTKNDLMGLSVILEDNWISRLAIVTLGHPSELAPEWLMHATQIPVKPPAVSFPRCGFCDFHGHSGLCFKDSLTIVTFTMQLSMSAKAAALFSLLNLSNMACCNWKLWTWKQLLAVWKHCFSAGIDPEMGMKCFSYLSSFWMWHQLWSWADQGRNLCAEFWKTEPGIEYRM